MFAFKNYETFSKLNPLEANVDLVGLYKMFVGLWSIVYIYF